MHIATRTTTKPAMDRRHAPHCILSSLNRRKPTAFTPQSLTLGALLGLIGLVALHQVVECASNRGGSVETPRSNHYFLNEFCDIESKTYRDRRPITRTHEDATAILLNQKSSASSLRIQTKQPSLPSTIGFGFGDSSQQAVKPLVKQLNCSIIIEAPKSYGLLVNVNSVGLPKNLTRLGITLNYNSPHAQYIQFDADVASANYLLTHKSTSKIAISLQSFEAIDWSHVSFDILFSVYKQRANSTGCPNKKWFDCGDDICVPMSLVCDRNRNCPNGNDEMLTSCPLISSIAVSMGVILVLVILIVAIVTVVRRQRANQIKKQNSFLTSRLASEGDLINHLENSSKLDLTKTEQPIQRAGGSQQHLDHNSYLASNMYLSGFENPAWSNTGTLTKPTQTQRHHTDHNSHQQTQPIEHMHRHINL